MASDDFQREYLAKRIVNRLLLAIPEWVEKRAKHLVRIPRPALFRGHTLIDFGGNDPHAYQLGYWHAELGLVIERDGLLTHDEHSTLLSDAVKKAESETWGTKRWDGTLAALTTDMMRLHFRHGQPGGTDIPGWLTKEINREAAPQPFLRIRDHNMELAKHLHSVGLATVPTYKTEKQFMVQQLRNLIADGKYYVHPRCVDTDRHLRTTTWSNSKRKTWARRGGEHGDLVDTSVYFAMGVCRDVPVDPAVHAAAAMPAMIEEMGRPMTRLEARLQRYRGR